MKNIGESEKEVKNMEDMGESEKEVSNMDESEKEVSNIGESEKEVSNIGESEKEGSNLGESEKEVSNMGESEIEGSNMEKYGYGDSNTVSSPLLEGQNGAHFLDERDTVLNEVVTNMGDPATNATSAVEITANSDPRPLCWVTNKPIQFIICAVGVFVCYFYYGVLQEKVTQAEFVNENGDPEKFKYALSLVLFLCFTNAALAKFLLTFVWKEKEDTTTTLYYLTNALTYDLSMFCSNLALQFVNFPTQVVAKSVKPIPVMVLGVLVGRKSYPWKKYLFVLIMVTGVALFMYKDKKGATEKSTGFGFGEMLLIFSLIMDGLNGAVQERMKTQFKTKSMPMMYHINLYGGLYFLVGVVLTGEIVSFISYAQRHPQVVLDMLILSAATGTGQIFIFETISRFGPLPCAIITTVRKLFTVLFSVIFFGHSLLTRQWIAASVVFTGLFLDAYYAHKSS